MAINKLNHFPALIEFEVFKGEKWEVMVYHYCNNKEALYKKMETLRSLYAVSDRTYRIFITYQSKMNRYAKKKGNVETSPELNLYGLSYEINTNIQKSINNKQ